MRGAGGLKRGLVLTFACLVFFYATFNAQARDATCLNGDGDGNFSLAFRTGVTIHIGATKKDGFATHACDASLTWGDHTLTVASGVSLVDLDAFGVDLGVGEPVVAFEVHESDKDCCSVYKIYSLQKPLRLLRAITEGSFFSASDIDLDGRVEIWTDDASAVRGFENLSVAELDFAPPVVLRFDHNQLLDVGSEFQPYFDDLIAKLKSQLSPEDLFDFKGSDGKLLATSSAPVEYMHELRRVKIKILEMVWAYLYSGREEDAWTTLAKYWPATDIERVRGEIATFRKKGMRSQIDGLSSGDLPRKEKRAQIFDFAFGPERGRSELLPPQPILIRTPPPSGDHALTNTDVVLDLLIDSAGKIRSAALENAKVADPRLTDSAMQWKFIPAFRSDRPVACNLRFAISAKK